MRLVGRLYQPMLLVLAMSESWKTSWLYYRRQAVRTRYCGYTQQTGNAPLIITQEYESNPRSSNSLSLFTSRCSGAPYYAKSRFFGLPVGSLCFVERGRELLENGIPR